MNLFVLAGPHHLRPVGAPRAPIPTIPSRRCDDLDAVVAAMEEWAGSFDLIAVCPRHGGETVMAWLELSARLLSERHIVVHRSELTTLGAEVAVQQLLIGAGAEAPVVLATEALARTERDLTTGVIRNRRRVGRPREMVVELFSPRRRQLRSDQLGSLHLGSLQLGGLQLDATDVVLRYARHGGADRDLLDRVFPLAWLDVSIEEHPGELEAERVWTEPAIEFAAAVRPVVTA